MKTIKVGDLVEFDRDRFHSGYTRTGFLVNNEGRFLSPGRTLFTKEVFLYLGAAPAHLTLSASGHNLDVIIHGEEKLYVWNLLPELVKFNG